MHPFLITAIACHGLILSLGPLWCVWVIITCWMILLQRSKLLGRLAMYIPQTLLPIIISMSFMHYLLNWQYHKMLLSFIILSRVLAAFTVILWFYHNIDRETLIGSMLNAGISPSVCYILISPFQMLPLIRNRWKVIVEAQQIRGLNLQVPWYKRIFLLLPIVVPLFMQTMLSTQDLAIALNLRGFYSKGKKSFILKQQSKPWHNLVFYAIPGTLVLVLLLR